MRPTGPDRAIAESIARNTDPAIERVTRGVTLLADEKVMLVGAGLYWLYCRAAGCDRRTRDAADELLAGLAIASALPHVIKRVVDRERPDRAVVHVDRHGIAHSGNEWDSFPSGHAMHLGAVAASAARHGGAPWNLLSWPIAGALATTRMVLLAHWATDVIAGFAIGIGIEGMVNRLARWLRG